ncbi:classical arabinogalactan protein 9-like isoform X3 [Xenopus tropicalis]|uniref:Classical arabinogalactan protein 9-like isoform X3 n=1 Tax=Xenopus tropicalis TaxID=8364 RepID=A0A8J1JXL6_XENTR|nr:classical arabinogalactan protein 9-like isoform X3 [Xenopus tropicalis]
MELKNSATVPLLLILVVSQVCQILSTAESLTTINTTPTKGPTGVPDTAASSAVSIPVGPTDVSTAVETTKPPAGSASYPTEATLAPTDTPKPSTTSKAPTDPPKPNTTSKAPTDAPKPNTTSKGTPKPNTTSKVAVTTSNSPTTCTGIYCSSLFTSLALTFITCKLLG